MPIPPNFGDVLTQTASLFVFGRYLDVEQRLAIFCAPEARLLVADLPHALACSRPRDDRCFCRLPDEGAGPAIDSRQYHQRLRQRPGWLNQAEGNDASSYVR